MILGCVTSTTTRSNQCSQSRIAAGPSEPSLRACDRSWQRGLTHVACPSCSTWSERTSDGDGQVCFADTSGMVRQCNRECGQTPSVCKTYSIRRDLYK